MVGNTVLELQTTLENPLIRLYAHCGKKSRTGRASIAIFGMNLSTAEYYGKIVVADTNQQASYVVHQYLLTGINSDVSSKYVL